MNNNNDNITEHFNDEIRKLANSDKEVHKELVETITKFRDEEDDATEDDLWWDSSSPPPQFTVSFTRLCSTMMMCLCTF